MSSEAKPAKGKATTGPDAEQAAPAETPVQAAPAAAASSPPQAAPLASGTAIVPDTEDAEGDDDSAVNLSLASSSTSLASTILRYRQENGRTYHAYKEGRYILPNDEIENDRLDLQHHIFTLTFDGKLYLCPAGQDKQVLRVLDAGTGTGIWATDYADEHPEAAVVGVDLSPIQPTFVPPNVSFYVDDLEEPWNYSQRFDLIYGRMLTGSLSDWPKFVKQSYENLNPGGWLELADIGFPVTSDDGTLAGDSALRRWSDLLVEASENLGRTLVCSRSYKKWLEEQGFINVVELIFKWPQNSWPKDKKYKELGVYMCENMGSLSGLSLALFTRGLGWDPRALEVFLVDVRKDTKDRSKHSYWPVYVVYGQKPQ